MALWFKLRVFSCCVLYFGSFSCIALLGEESWSILFVVYASLSEPQHDKTNKMACAPSEGSDQPGHAHAPSLIRVFAVA